MVQIILMSPLKKISNSKLRAELASHVLFKKKTCLFDMGGRFAKASMMALHFRLYRLVASFRFID